MLNRKVEKNIRKKKHGYVEVEAKKQQDAANPSKDERLSA